MSDEVKESALDKKVDAVAEEVKTSLEDRFNALVEFLRAHGIHFEG